MNVVQKAGISILKGIFKKSSRSRLPKLDGNIELKGISGNVEILRDRWGIPHIYATSMTDVLFAQGFVHAQDRLWQMEVNRRAARGQLSAFIGREALDADRVSRTFGYERIGRQDLELFSADERQLVQAYCDGINACTAQKGYKLPLEFALVKLKAHHWEPLDVMAISRLLTAQMSWGWHDELIRAQLIALVGPEAAAELDNTYPEGHAITLPKGIEYGKIATPERLRGMDDPIFPKLSGSNAWTVAGHRTITGKPYLCNDPHLPVTNPNIWYEIHLDSPELRVSGVSICGLPMVPIGHNEHISWGVTLAFTDIEDLFVEKFTDEHCHEYQYKDGLRKAVHIEERIEIKGEAEPVVEKIITTEHGTIISDIIGHADQKLALRSMALQPGRAIWGWKVLNQARDWDGFREAVSYLTAPGLNIVYADTEGNIGYYNSGSMPVKTREQASIPMPGWTGENDWDAFVPFDEMPHAVNPEKGYIVTCNHKVEPGDFRHFLGDIYMNGYRAVRLEALFAQQDKFGPKDFTAMQMDFDSIPGKAFQKYFVELEFGEDRLDAIRRTLCDWNGVLDAESVGGALYKVVKYYVVKCLYEKDIPDERLLHALLGRGFHPSFGPANTFLGHNTSTLLRLLKQGEASWWIRNYGGTEKLLKDGFRRAVRYMENTLDEDHRQWHWGRLHQMEIPHALSIKKPLNRIFNLGPFPIGGDTDTPFQTYSMNTEGFGGEIAAPSYRQIVDLSDFDRSLTIMPGGQSGNLASPYYADQLEDWRNGRFHPMCWSRQKVEEFERHRLVLQPL